MVVLGLMMQGLLWMAVFYVFGVLLSEAIPLKRFSSWRRLRRCLGVPYRNRRKTRVHCERGSTGLFQFPVTWLS